MAYYNIEKRLKSDGTPRYRCNVIIKEKGVITYRESKTFPKHAHAKTWGTQKVMELDLYGIPSSNAVDGLTVRDLLHKYLNDPNAGGKAGRTKRYVLELLMDSDISAIKLSELTENDVIEHCRLRNNAGAGPATVSHDVSYLGSVLDAAKPVYGINYTSNPAKSARPYCFSVNTVHDAPENYFVLAGSGFHGMPPSTPLQHDGISPWTPVLPPGGSGTKSPGGR